MPINCEGSLAGEGILQPGEAELHAELDALFNSQNASQSEDATSIPATFLRVTVAV